MDNLYSTWRSRPYANANAHRREAGWGSVNVARCAGWEWRVSLGLACVLWLLASLGWAASAVQAGGTSSVLDKMPSGNARAVLNDNEPFSLNGLCLFMSSAEVEARLGQGEGAVSEGYQVCADGTIISVRDGMLINLCVSGAEGTWSLKHGERLLVSLGDSEAAVKNALGHPSGVYCRADRPSRVMVYSTASGDAGILVRDHKVVGMMLAESGLLGSSLLYNGYTMESEAK